MSGPADVRGSANTSLLLTGAAGLIGRSLHERLPALGWDVRAFDRVAAPGVIVGDVNSADDLDAAMQDVTAVAHFAGYPREAPWPVVREANVDGVLSVFEAARRAGVRRVVLASSIHAGGFIPVHAHVSTDEPPRPDTLYGVSKVFDEALGRYYVDRYGMQVACLRLGTFGERPTDPTVTVDLAVRGRLRAPGRRLPAVARRWTTPSSGAPRPTPTASSTSRRRAASVTSRRTTPTTTPPTWPR